MIGFEYNYTLSSDIVKNLKLISQYSAIEYGILIISIILLILTIYYIIPIINIFFKFRKTEKEKLKRRELIKQIALQKNINDEIEKELNI